MRNLKKFDQLNESLDGVEIVDMTKELSVKLQDSNDHASAIQNMILNAYQMDVDFTEADLAKISGAFDLINK